MSTSGWRGGGESIADSSVSECMFAPSSGSTFGAVESGIAVLMVGTDGEKSSRIIVGPATAGGGRIDAGAFAGASSARSQAGRSLASSSTMGSSARCAESEPEMGKWSPVARAPVSRRGLAASGAADRESLSSSPFGTGCSQAGIDRANPPSGRGGNGVPSSSRAGAIGGSTIPSLAGRLLRSTPASRSRSSDAEFIGLPRRAGANPAVSERVSSSRGDALSSDSDRAMDWLSTRSFMLGVYRRPP